MVGIKEMEGAFETTLDGSVDGIMVVEFILGDWDISTVGSMVNVGERVGLVEESWVGICVDVGLIVGGVEDRTVGK